MSYRIEFIAAARRQFAALPRHIQRSLARRIDALADDPRPPQSRSLKGSLKGRRRIRAGDYRVIYTVEDEVLLVLVISVGHRQSIYDEARRRGPS